MAMTSYDVTVSMFNSYEPFQPAPRLTAGVISANGASGQGATYGDFGSGAAQLFASTMTAGAAYHPRAVTPLVVRGVARTPRLPAGRTPLRRAAPQRVRRTVPVGSPAAARIVGAHTQPRRRPVSVLAAPAHWARAEWGPGRLLREGSAPAVRLRSDSAQEGPVQEDSAQEDSALAGSVRQTKADRVPEDRVQEDRAPSRLRKRTAVRQVRRARQALQPRPAGHVVRGSVLARAVPWAARRARRG